MSGRISKRFAALRAEGRAGFIPFVTAGDPDPEASAALLEKLPQAGADLIELGVPFTDPMADGPAIQQSSLRALKAGMTLSKVLAMVARFRTGDAQTPIVLMGYFNPIHMYGVERFLADARAAGVDGLIVVDLPPEEDDALCLPAHAAGLDFIRLATPTTDAKRLPTILTNAAGFLYYVSVTGVTGAGSAKAGVLEEAMRSLRSHTDLPLAIGFGIKTPEQAAQAARIADAVVVGSAIVTRMAEAAGKDDAAESVAAFVRGLSAAVRMARTS